MEESNSPKVGIQTLIIKDGKFLIGADTRKGETVFGVPGGNWENGETLEQGAAREVLEESGVTCQNYRFLCNYEFYREDKQRSYISVGYIADYLNGELADNVEEGRVNWSWMEPSEVLKLNLYPPGRFLIETYLKNNQERD